MSQSSNYDSRVSYIEVQGSVALQKDPDNSFHTISPNWHTILWWPDSLKPRLKILNCSYPLQIAITTFSPSLCHYFKASGTFLRGDVHPLVEKYGTYNNVLIGRNLICPYDDRNPGGFINSERLACISDFQIYFFLDIMLPIIPFVCSRSTCPILREEISIYWDCRGHQYAMLVLFRVKLPFDIDNEVRICAP